MLIIFLNIKDMLNEMVEIERIINKARLSFFRYSRNIFQHILNKVIKISSITEKKQRSEKQFYLLKS